MATQRTTTLKDTSKGGFLLQESIGLNNLYLPLRARRQEKRFRGVASGGRTHGRGNGGQKSRSGHGIPVGFEGGQTPLHKKLPKLPLIPLVHRKRFNYIHLDTLQHWINIGRIDPSKPITIKTLYDAKLGNIKNGVILKSRGAENFDCKGIHIEVSRVEQKAYERIEELNGLAIAIHHGSLGLRTLLRPHDVIYKKTAISRSCRSTLESLLLKDTNSSLNPIPPNIGGDPNDSYVGGVFFSQHPTLGRMSKDELRIFLHDPNSNTEHKQLLLSFLSKFSGPVTSHDIEYYTSNTNRGYLSPFILERLGRKMVQFDDPKLLSMSGLEYWIQRGYITITKDSQECKEILLKYGYDKVTADMLATLNPKKAKRAEVKAKLDEEYEKMKQEISTLGLRIHYERGSKKRLGRRSIEPLERIDMKPASDVSVDDASIQ